MLTYYVKLTPNDNGTLLVICPDLPEVATFGENVHDALGYAAGAIEEALAARMAHKKDIPLPAKDTPEGLHPVRLPTQTTLRILDYRKRCNETNYALNLY